MIDQRRGDGGQSGDGADSLPLEPPASRLTPARFIATGLDMASIVWESYTGTQVQYR